MSRIGILDPEGAKKKALKKVDQWKKKKEIEKRKEKFKPKPVPEPSQRVASKSEKKIKHSGNLKKIERKQLEQQLLKAARDGEIEKVKELLEKTNVNAKTESGITALMMACDEGHEEIAGLLIKKRADVNAKEKNDNLTALMLACYHGHKDLVELLIAHRVDVNAEDKKGRTALMVASNRGHTEIAELLKYVGAKEGESWVGLEY